MKEIKRNTTNRDYDMFFDGRYIGSRQTYHECEVELDRIAYDLLVAA